MAAAKPARKRKPAPKRAKVPTPSVGFADLDPTEFRRSLLRDVLADIDRARAAGSQSVVMQQVRAAMALRREIAEADQEDGVTTSRPLHSVTDEQLVERLVAMVGKLPDVALEELEEAIRVRRAGKPAVLRVVEG